METMRERIEGAIDSAMKNLETSMKALAEGNEEALRKGIWKASADAEYALFLLSLAHEGGSKDSSWKSETSLKKLEAGPALALAQDLLAEAKEKMGASDLDEAYRRTWLAQGYLLKAQTALEKRRREDVGPDAPPPKAV